MSEQDVRISDETFARFCVRPDTRMRDVLSLIDANGEGVAMVVDADQKFVDIVTDGDIRRAILMQADFDEPVSAFLGKIEGPGPAKPLTALSGTDEADLVRLIEENGVRHLPILDKDGHLAGVVLASELARDQKLPVRAVVMAGGFGVRLRPLTDGTPKPLLHVGEKPVIEHIVHKLRDSGVSHVNITTHYHADKIRDHFKDGTDFGVEVKYTHEEEPLGTAGALSMLQDTEETLLVMNGDILTDVDVRAMFDFHRDHKSDITIGVRRYEVPVPFGVIEADGASVTKLEEKPSLSFFINAGVYLLEPTVVRILEPGKKIDMTDLIQKLLDEDGVVTSFPIHEYWIDIGQMDDYLKAQTDMSGGKLGGG